jgi:hypothetical protein
MLKNGGPSRYVMSSFDDTPLVVAFQPPFFESRSLLL